MLLSCLYRDVKEDVLKEGTILDWSVETEDRIVVGIVADKNTSWLRTVSVDQIKLIEGMTKSQIENLKKE